MTERERETETEREKRDTDRDRDRETERERGWRQIVIRWISTFISAAHCPLVPWLDDKSSSSKNGNLIN